MIYLTLGALILGVVVGLFFDNAFLHFFVVHKTYLLYGLMFFVGISVGMQKGLLAKLARHRFKIVLIPIGIIVGSLMGGVVCHWITGIALNESLAVASGLGWYSLAGVTITDLVNAELGSIAFLSCFMREIFSFICIPFLAKYCNHLTCIAPAASTSGDMMLSVILKHTNEETAIIAVFNGVVCSTVVPFLIVATLAL